MLSKSILLLSSEPKRIAIVWLDRGKSDKDVSDDDDDDDDDDDVCYNCNNNKWLLSLYMISILLFQAYLYVSVLFIISMYMYLSVCIYNIDHIHRSLYITS